MNVIVQSKDVAVTKAIRNFIQLQIERKIFKMNNRVSQIRVYLEHIARKDSDPKRALVKFKALIPGKKPVIVKSTSHNLYDAIVDATDGVARKIRKVKEKRRGESRSEKGYPGVLDEQRKMSKV